MGHKTQCRAPPCGGRMGSASLGLVASGGLCCRELEVEVTAQATYMHDEAGSRARRCTWLRVPRAAQRVTLGSCR